MVRKDVIIPIEYAEKVLGFVCNYEFRKGENKGCKCYGKICCKHSYFLYDISCIKINNDTQKIKL